MIRRWLLPVLIGILLGYGIYRAALVNAPRFLMAAAVRRVVSVGRFNAMTHAPLATAASRAIVRPSPDLAYSTCVFDLTPGPVEVVIPPLSAPYWSLSVFDARTDVAFVRNNRDTGDGPVRIFIAGQNQPVPAGAQVVRVNGARGIALLRVLVEDRARFAPLDRARRAATCRILGV
ncbi:MAG TPA: DUF1254 domain-containing protein [Sphingomonas sp.]|uniref:DUF1254 domain-containing protein n=1 Tax=Sphingomonas sp. TaxID=28214 RepID=UPI002ED93ED4